MTTTPNEQNTTKSVNPAWPVGLLLAVTAVWGGTFVLVQDVIQEMPVFAFLFWRFGIAGLALALLRPTALTRLNTTDLKHGVLLGLMLAAGYTAQTIGLKHTSATVAGFITGMFVVFTPLVAAVALKKRITPTTWFAVGLATFGLALMSFNGFSIGFGELIMIVCALAFAAQLVFLGEWTSTERAYGLTVVQLLIVAAVSGIASLFDGGPELPPTTNAWVATIFLALVATAAAYLIQAWAQAHITPTRAAIILTMEPVFAGIFGVALAGDVITLRMAVGGIFILAAMYVIELSAKPVEIEPSPHP
jgi:drug/metabolite transporter (DMT)-like permease